VIHGSNGSANEQASRWLGRDQHICALNYMEGDWFQLPQVKRATTEQSD
jgi:hypothetical protein